MVKDESTLTNEIVKKQYEELMTNGLPFLQIFPEMIQESNVAETFKTRANERYKGLTQDNIIKIKLRLFKNYHDHARSFKYLIKVFPDLIFFSANLLEKDDLNSYFSYTYLRKRVFFLKKLV